MVYDRMAGPEITPRVCEIKYINQLHPALGYGSCCVFPPLLSSPTLSPNFPEITPRRRALLVALRHGWRLGVAPVSFRTIQSILDIPKYTCSGIYKHALKNSTANRWDLHFDCASASLSTEDADIFNADIFLAGIQAHLDEIYTEPGPRGCLGLEEMEEEVSLLEIISAGV